MCIVCLCADASDLDLEQMDWLFVVARMGKEAPAKSLHSNFSNSRANTGQKIQHTPWCETPLMINSMFPTTMSDCTGSTTQHLSMMHWACSHHCPIWVCSSVPRFPGWAPMDSTSGKNGGGPNWANSSINMIFVLACSCELVNLQPITSHKNG